MDPELKAAELEHALEEWDDADLNIESVEAYELDPVKYAAILEDK